MYAGFSTTSCAISGNNFLIAFNDLADWLSLSFRRQWGMQEQVYGG